MPRPDRVPTLIATLTALGGVGEYAELVHASSRGALGRAVRDGLVVRVGRGLYAVSDVGDSAVQGPSRPWSRWEEGPNEDEQRVLAARLARARGAEAALSHLSAAAHHGWAVLVEPDVVDLAVPRGRCTPSRPGVRVRRAHLTPDELRDHCTSPLRTVLDCARHLPRAEALAVADSALRSGAVGPRELTEAGATYRGTGAAGVRWVAEHANRGAANPFESALRACVLDIPGLNVRPQVEITDAGFHARVDLADEHLGIVLEADSYEFHGTPEAFAKDRRRYAELTVRGWAVLPFGFADVTGRPDWVRSTVTGAVILRSRKRSSAA